MKKIFSAALAAALCFASLSSLPVGATDYRIYQPGQDFTKILEVGQHLKKGDMISGFSDNGNVTFAVSTLIDGEEKFDYWLRGGYTLTRDMVVCGVLETYVYLVAEEDVENCVDIRTLKVGDTVDSEKYIINYGWKIDGASRGFCKAGDFFGDGEEVYCVDEKNNAVTLRCDKNIGDANNDGSFNIADIAILQKWLLSGDLRQWQWKWQNADMNGDRTIDVFDLCIMRKKLAEKYSEYSSMNFISLEKVIELLEESTGRTITDDDFADYGYRIVEGSVREYPVTDEGGECSETIRMDGDRIVFFNPYSGEEFDFYAIGQFIASKEND